MRKDIAVSGIVLLIAGIVLIPFLQLFIQPPATPPIRLTRTLEIPPSEERGVPLSLRPEDTVEGHFTVRGGANDDIVFYIEDPEGNIIYKPSGRVVGYDSFRFTATMDGEYFLWFDNSFSLISPKTVYLTVEIKLGKHAVQHLWELSISELRPIIQIVGGVMAIIGLLITVWGITAKPREGTSK